MRGASFGGTLIALLLSAGEALRADPTTDAERVASLIRQLGDDDFARRQQASRDLASVGEPALPVLRKFIDSEDLELRGRARQLIRTIIAGLRKSPSTGLALAAIDPAQFTMGSPKNEYGRRPDEQPHDVHVTRPYLIGAYEVTQDEYRQVMKASPSWFAPAGGGKDKVADKDTARFPVESVTWFDAVTFCNRLSRLDGYEPYYKLTDEKREGDTVRGATVTVQGGNGFRLPTEAEWELAARGGARTPFHFGHSNTGREANLKPGPAIGYGSAPNWPTLNRTTTVGAYKPNAWGLFEAHGNAAEWCGDWYDKDFYIKSPADDPIGPADGVHRVVRGGSWLVNEGSCRAASRFFLTPDEAKEYVGFRVARSP